MKPSQIQAVDAAREFRVDEMFFSTTDARGVIALGNAVFVRVSGYPAAELIGSPHNLIRHPDMPRAAFRLVWGHLKQNRPVVAYVKNQAHDGRYYWVVALLTPIGDGYLSIRFKPTSPLQQTVAGLYAQMLAAEQAAAASDAQGRGQAAMDEAERLLTATLKQLGFADYDAFMRSLLHDELKSRDAQLAAAGLVMVPPLPAPDRHGRAPGGVIASLREVYAGGQRIYDQINRLYARLDAFAAMNEELEEKSRFVLRLTGEFRFISINAALEATKLGEEGRSLGVIASYLGEASNHISATVRGLTGRIHEVLEKLRAILFNFAGARLQIEMTLIFCHESLAALTQPDHAMEEAVVETHQRMIRDLQTAFRDTNRRAVGALSELQQDLGVLNQHSQDLHRTVTSLQVAHISGMVEANQLRNEAAFAGMFGEVRTQIDTTREELHELDTIIERLGGLAREAPDIAATIATAVEQMDRDVRGLSVPVQSANQKPVAPSAPRARATMTTRARLTAAGPSHLAELVGAAE